MSATAREGPLEQAIQSHQEMGQNICRAMLESIVKIGFSVADIASVPDFSKAEFSLVKDPYTASENLKGIWYDQHKQRIGNIQFLSDGSFYAEYDVVKPHPRKKQWFVEGVNAWGKEGKISAEPKLIQAL